MNCSTWSAPTRGGVRGGSGEPDGQRRRKSYPFEIDSFRRHCMINGLDSIGLTLQHEADISRYEAQQPAFLN